MNYKGIITWSFKEVGFKNISGYLVNFDVNKRKLFTGEKDKYFFFKTIETVVLGIKYNTWILRRTFLYVCPHFFT